MFMDLTDIYWHCLVRSSPRAVLIGAYIIETNIERVVSCVHMTSVLEQGNIQRCNHYVDQMNEVKSSLERFIGERRPQAVEFISRHQSKRAVKKKERHWRLNDELLPNFSPVRQFWTQFHVCRQISVVAFLSLQRTLQLSGNCNCQFTRVGEIYSHLLWWSVQQSKSFRRRCFLGNQLIALALTAMQYQTVISHRAALL